MKAPKCRTCGKEHWGSVCNSPKTERASLREPQPVPEAATSARRTKSTAAKAPAVDPAMFVSQGQYEAFKADGVPEERMRVVGRIPAPSPSGKAPGFGPGTEGSNPSGASTILYAGAPKPGRPRIHPDRKAYKAAKERERRARLKAEREAK